MNDIKAKAAELVSNMTLEEKVSQMLHGASEVRRLGIPSYNWWNEALHGVARSGVATMFPQAIAMAAAFDPDLVARVADICAIEARAKFHEYQREGDHDIFKGITLWSPNINIFRDPRWGRGHETYGEDPYLTAQLGVAFIKGLQGSDRDQLKTAACAKHFAVHSGPEDLRHEFDAVCDWYDLWNTYLPAFEAAVTQGEVEIVMGAYNRTLGEPCCGSQLLLQDILRDKWGFDGHVVSDCWAIKDFHENHRITKTPVESVALAVSKGCDLNCGNMFGYCLQAVDQGLLTEQQIDQAVTRLFVTRMRLGLLGAPTNPQYTAIPYEAVDCSEHQEWSLEVARRSIVLLKNNGILPLKHCGLKTIGVIGPNADSRRALEGNYEGTASQHITVLSGVRQFAEQHDLRVMFAQGCHLYRDSVSGLSKPNDRIAEARIVARNSDVVLLCLGLDADIEGEEGDQGNEFSSGDKNTLDLPAPQQVLLEQVVDAAQGKPVVVILISGSALAVGWADQHVDAIVQAFYPGAMGGEAIAQMLFGDISPSGKLPVTFYHATQDLPDFTDYSMKDRTYRYFKKDVLYPFGYGLTYSSFSLGDFTACRSGCSVTVCNIGQRKARETVQIYVQSPRQRERHNLCGFCSVLLEPGESRRVNIALNQATFARYSETGDLQVIQGVHKLYAGFSQPDPRSIQLYGVTPLEAELVIE